MLKSDVIEQLKSLLENAEYSRNAEKESKYCSHSSLVMYEKDVKALATAIEAVKAFDYDEREEITVTLKAKKSPEGDNTYYCDLETGERLVIRGGQLEGIYNPNSDDENSEYEKTTNENLLDAVLGIYCSKCPCHEFCGKCSTVGCAETFVEWLKLFTNK